MTGTPPVLAHPINNDTVKVENQQGARRQLRIEKLGRWDSNLGMARPKPAALPLGDGPMIQIISRAEETSLESR